ncbi:MAG: carbohydrate ABC transporter permease [Beutenbergiaceae bacterium]
MRRRWIEVARNLTLGLLAALTLFPLVLVISTSLRTTVATSRDPFALFDSFTMENFVTAFVDDEFGELMWNSALIVVPSTLLTAILATMAGYAFARLQFPLRNALFAILVLGMLVPFFAIMVPLFTQLRLIGLLDSLVGTSLILLSTQLSLGTFIMRAYFQGLPVELEQAARIDGASELRIFTDIMAPLARSGTVSLAVLVFVVNWNNLIVPLLYMPSGQFRTLTSGLYLYASGRASDFGPLAAGSIIAIIPVAIVFFAFQRQLVTGLVSGAVKG